MDAVILKTGSAVKITNMSNLRFDIEDGLLVCFNNIHTNKEVRFFDKGSDPDLAKYNFHGDYYYVEDYAIFTTMPSIDSFLEFTQKVYKEFPRAENTDTIQIDVMSVEDLTAPYKVKRYSFVHNNVGNYLVTPPGGSGGFDPEFYDENPVTIGKDLQTVSHEFFNNHKIYVNSDVDFYRALVRCCIRIEMIKDDIYPLFENDLPDNDEADLIITFLESFNFDWSTKLIFKEDDDFDIKKKAILDYFYVLFDFYINSYYNQKKIKSGLPIIRIQYLVYLADIEMLNNVPPFYKIKLIQEIAQELVKKGGAVSKKFHIETILILIDSFKEDNVENIDLFLFHFIGPKFNVRVEERIYKENQSPSFISVSNHIDKREEITLFEHLYNLLKPGFLVQMLRFSKLYKKINSSLNLKKDSLDSRAQFIACVYTLWVKSTLNPNRNNTYNPNCIGFEGVPSEAKFNYTRNPATTFYTQTGDPNIRSLLDRTKAPLIINIDNYLIPAAGVVRDSCQTRFCDYNKILIETSDFRHANHVNVEYDINNISQFNAKRNFFSFGYYNIFQPIQIVYSDVNYKESIIFNHSWMDEDTELQNTQRYVPAFFFHYMQEKAEEEFIYSICWVGIESFYNVLENLGVVRVLSDILEKVDFFLDLLEEIIPETNYQYLNEYAINCTLDTISSDFCTKINILVFWLNQNQASRSSILNFQIRDSAYDILVYVEQNGWPDNFDNNDAKSLIEDFADQGNSSSDLEQIVVNMINEENANNSTPAYSFYEDGTDELLLSSADILEVSDYVSILNLDDDFSSHSKKEILIAFIFNAYRIGKQANLDQLKARIDLWVNMKKPIIDGGRDKIPYCFGTTMSVAEPNFSLFLTKMNEMFTNLNLMSYEDKRIGGSALYKNPPGDLDLYLFVDQSEMNELYHRIQGTWLKLYKESSSKRMRERADSRIKRLKNIINKKGFIYGYLVVTYDPQFRLYFFVDEMRRDQYYVSTIVNHTSTDDALIDLTIKNSFIDKLGTPPYLILNI